MRKAKETTMQALKRIAQLVLPVAVGLPGLAVHASASEVLPQPAVTQSAQSDSTSARSVVSTAPADGPASASVTPPAKSDPFGVAMNAEQLDGHRGGDALIATNTLNGRVSDNTANRIVTGQNTITQGSFANASGLPTVIQNSGANVLIQNATILNVRFGN
jgi:LysM repeat protein